jgi:hypothetical protein
LGMPKNGKWCPWPESWLFDIIGLLVIVTAELQKFDLHSAFSAVTGAGSFSQTAGSPGAIDY